MFHPPIIFLYLICTLKSLRALYLISEKSKIEDDNIWEFS